MFEDNEDVLTAIQTALSGEIKILQIKLEQFSFEVNYSPLYDANGRIIGLISLYFDITESLKAQEIIRSEKEKSDRLLLNILPEKIANELKENGFVKPVLYESVTVIFTDFKGFTKIASHMLPEDLLEKLDMIFLQFDQICERRNIEKLKTIGDAYMCAGGCWLKSKCRLPSAPLSKRRPISAVSSTSTSRSLNLAVNPQADSTFPAFFNVAQYHPRPLIARSNEWVSPIVVVLRDVDNPRYSGGRELGLGVLKALGMGTGFTHMEW